MACFLVLQAAVERYTKTDPATAALHRCYRGFSRLSVLNERLGLRSGYTKGGACTVAAADHGVLGVRCLPMPQLCVGLRRSTKLDTITTHAVFCLLLVA
jgi:hypothetical protein